MDERQKKDQAADEPRRLVGADPTELQHWARTCPDAGTITGYSLTLARQVWIAARCGRWSCSACGPRKVWRLAFKVADARPNRLLTLTVNPSRWHDPREAFDATRRKVPVLIRELRQKHGEVEYVRVLEVTKKGWPHYHLIMRSGFLPQVEISRKWDSLTGAPVVDIRTIEKSSVVLGYVVKYLSKQEHVPWTERRIAWSKRFFRNDQVDQAQSLQLELLKRSRIPFHVYATSFLQGKTLVRLFGQVFGIAYDD